MDDIYFYGKKDGYYEFSNYSPCKFVIDGVEYISVEQYYQAQKFYYGDMDEITEEYYNLMIECDSPQKSKSMGSQREHRFGEKWFINKKKPHLGLMNDTIRKYAKAKMNPNWENEKDNVMFTGLYYKFSTNRNLKNLLIGTGSKRIHENSPKDMYWGVLGKDMLGILLCEIREKLVSEV